METVTIIGRTFIGRTMLSAVPFFLQVKRAQPS
jgi:hypothetical protein